MPVLENLLVFSILSEYSIVKGILHTQSTKFLHCWKLLKIAQLSILCDYTVHGIIHARIMKWVAFPSWGDLSSPGMDPGSPTLQADSLPASHQGSPRIPEWVAFPFSSGSSWPRNWTGASCTAGRFKRQDIHNEQGNHVEDQSICDIKFRIGRILHNKPNPESLCLD